MADAASPRNRLQVDERRAQLVELALKLFAERTYEGISIDEIAKVAGISKGLLYHYFPSKRAFYLAALREAAQRLLDAAIVDSGEPASGEPEVARMRQGIDAYLVFVEEHSVQYAFLLRGGLGGDADVRDIVESTRTRFFSHMLQRIGDPDNERVRIAVRGLVGFVEVACLEWLERKHVSRLELADMLVQICVSTVAIAVGHHADE